MQNSSKTIKKRNQQKNTEYKKKLTQLKNTGIYNTNSKNLTKHQKSKINKLWLEYGDSLDKSKTMFVKIPKSEQHRAKKILQNAKSLKLKTTATGIFITKNGQRRARIVYNTKLHETELHLSGKVKSGIRQGKHIKQILPIVSIDKMKNLENYIRSQGEAIKLQKGEFLQFRVIEDGHSGLSHKIFSTTDILVNYLKNNYSDKEPINKILFYRHIVVEKTTIKDWKSERKIIVSRKSNKKRKMDKKGRSI